MEDVKSIEESIAKGTTPAFHVQGGIERTLLQDIDFPDGSNINTSIIVVPTGTSADRHTHPGIEIGYVLEGEFYLCIAGRPDQHLKAGNSYSIPVGAVHYARVPADKAMRVLCIFITDKTKPLATVVGPGS